MALVSEKSAPRPSTFWLSGPAVVLSTTLSAPAARAASANPAMSYTSSFGFEGDSSHTIAAPGSASSSSEWCARRSSTPRGSRWVRARRRTFR